MWPGDDAVTEVTAEILIIAFVIILAAIVLVIIFGVLPKIQESAFLSTEVRLVDYQGATVLSLLNRGGDTLTFSDTLQGPFPSWVYLDTPNDSYHVTPDLTAATFRPGNTVYIYYDGTDYRMTGNIAAASPVSLPSPAIRLRIVDRAASTLLQDWRTASYQAAVQAPGPVNTTTITPTPTVTVTPTPTDTTTATPTPTATATTTPSSYTISVSWSPGGLGTISPPDINPGTVSVNSGSDQTFTVTPRSNKKVLSISVDGSQVSSGGAVGQAVTYTLVNVQAAHTLTATFG